MKLSTKGRYGLRSMIELGMNEHTGPVATHLIAQKQNIPERYLEQLLIPLRRAGLVKSVRGSQGGYLLSKKASEISVGDIIRVLEGPIAPVDCVNEVNPEECSRSESCVTRGIWSQVRDSVTKVLDSYTLEDLITQSKSLEDKSIIIECLTVT